MCAAWFFFGTIYKPKNSIYVQNMTCQLVLFNGYGAVLASDSAVTMGNRRVYDTAEKITPLPAPHQIAILDSGSAFLHQFPVQVLLEEFGKTLGTTRLSTAVEYQRKFVEFLESSALFSDEVQNSAFCGHIENHISSLKNAITKQFPSPDRTHDEMSQIITYWREWYEKYAPNQGSDDEWFDGLWEINIDEISNIFGRYFNDQELIDSIITDLFSELAAYATRAPQHGGNTTLSFVGYGEHELMPSYSQFHFLGFTGNKLQHWHLANDKFDSADPLNRVGVKLIAQTDAIETFIRGFARDAHESARSILRDTIGQISDVTKSAETPPNEDSEGEVEDLMAKRQEELKRNAEAKIDELGSAREEEFYDVIAGLPPATLATVAESLIGIQSLHQAVTAKLNTVGGPIDTAMITRANGFQWIRHKSIS
jgi:hypothetical protein